MRRLAGRTALGLLAIALAGLVAFWALNGAYDDIADRPVPDLPDGALKIVAFGSSLTAKNDWPDALADRLAACRGAAVEMIHVAKPGAGSTWGVGAVTTVIAAEPDLVLMEFAINDADLRDGVGFGKSQDQHEVILQRLADELPEARVLLMTMSPAHGLRGAMRPRLGAYYQGYRDLAEAHGAGLLDLYPRWRGGPKALRTFEDGLHPSNEAVREVLLNPAETLLCEE